MATRLPPSNNPLMPPAKQQRILIWRTEVASALSIETAASVTSASASASASSSGAAHHTTGDDSSTGDSPSYTHAYAISPPGPISGPVPDPVLPSPSPSPVVRTGGGDNDDAASRPRSLWKRLSWHLVPRRRRHTPRDDLVRRGLEHSGPVEPMHTAMYRDPATAKYQSTLLGDDDGNPDLDLDADDDDASRGGDGGLKDKQERLQRAERLLNRGVREGHGAGAIQAHRGRNLT